MYGTILNEGKDSMEALHSSPFQDAIFSLLVTFFGCCCFCCCFLTFVWMVKALDESRTLDRTLQITEHQSWLTGTHYRARASCCRHCRKETWRLYCVCDNRAKHFICPVALAILLVRILLSRVCTSGLSHIRSLSCRNHNYNCSNCLSQSFV